MGQAKLIVAALAGLAMALTISQCRRAEEASGPVGLRPLQTRPVTAAENRDPPAPEEVVFRTDDGFEIHGFLSLPEGADNPRVVICAHEWRRDHHRYDAFVPALLDAGFAVLAYDVRGHGLSTNQNGRKVTWEDFDAQARGRMFRDFGAAIEYLKTRQDVDASEVGVIGASYGGYSAYAASGLYPEVRAAVCLSAAAYFETDQPLKAIRSEFRPHTILFVLARGDRGNEEAGRKLLARTAEPKDLVVYTDSSAHGTDMAKDHPELIERTVKWLTRYVRGEG